MMSRKFVFQFLALIGIVLCVNIPGSAQHNLTLYGMKSLPQRTYANPALRPDSRFFIGIPALSSVYTDFSNSSLQLNKIGETLDRKSEDSVVINLNKLPGLFRENNSLSNTVSLDLLHLGFEVGDNNYFTFNTTLFHKAKVSFSGDLPKLIFEGNGGKNLAYPFDLGVHMDLLHYAEIALGYSRRLKDDRLAIGARVKYLKGLLSLNTERSDIRFETDPGNYDLIATTDIRINYSNNFGDIVQDGINIGDSEFWRAQDFSEYRSFGELASKNSGWGLDLGATYDLTKKIELSASIINLGRLYWNQRTSTYTSRNPGSSFVFEGIDLKNFDSLSNTDYIVNQLVDTLIDRFGLDSSGSKYSTGLFPEFYLGGTFSFTKNHRLGALFYGDWFQKRLHPAFSITWYSQVARSLSFSASYTIMNNSFNNLGLGFATNAGPFQFYLISDNLIQVMAPEIVRNWNVRFGFNLTLLRKPKEKKSYEGK